jgi:hypothetical protein
LALTRLKLKTNVEIRDEKAKVKKNGIEGVLKGEVGDWKTHFLTGERLKQFGIIIEQ